ncbi:MAG: hypothetical protein V3T33_09635 [Myxococcota bacterium]
MATSASIHQVNSPSTSRGNGSTKADHRRIALTALALGATVLLSGMPARAANVVGIRLGTHEDYSRVVFELDAPAGYRIERNELAPGVAELVVSLDAGTNLRGPKVGNRLIERVDIESRGPSSSIARIRLKGTGLRLKEMILANPPRIVLDILRKRVAKPAPRATTKRETPAPSPTRRVTAAAEPPTSPSPAPSVAPAPIQVAKVVEKPTRPPPVEPAPMAPEPELPVPPPGEAPPDQTAQADEETSEPNPTQLARATPTTPPSVPARMTPARASRPSSGEDSLFTLSNMAMALGGVALVGVAGVLVIRRRAAAAVEDVGFSDGGVDDDPFAGLGGDDSMSASSVAPVTSASPAPAGASSEQLNEVTRELERRITSLENRLEESANEREKLDRQVAAQTEELRVQRAAIARTQRAVRNLSRPEEEGATEPALREPKPPGA